MKKIALFVLALAASHSAYAQSTNPLTGGARLHYGIIKGIVTRAAAKMPEEKYPFRPTPEVRTFAQLIGHLADANYRICSVLAGRDPPLDAGIEKTKKTKPDLVNALAESFAYCDRHCGSGRPGGAGKPGGSAPLVFTYLTHLTYPTHPTNFFTDAEDRS